MVGLRRRTGRRQAIWGLILCGLMLALSPLAAATSVNGVPAAQVSFSFDDGLASALSQAAPILARYGLTGTDYVITGCVGMSTVPNTCRANTRRPYMSWPQVQSLQNDYGWEIGSHTVDHKCLADSAATDPADCQKNLLTTAQIDAELANSKTALQSHGVTATDMSTPYGDYNNNVLAQIAKYYASMRGFKDAGANIWPYNEYLINDVPVEETVNTVADLESRIDQAIMNKQWLVLTFHDIAETPSQTPEDYQYGAAELDQVAAYVAAKQQAGLLRSGHISQGSASSDTNMLPNGSFNQGLGGGWATDNAAAIIADAGNNGSYPDPANAIKLSTPATGTNAHLFSPRVPVNATTTYLFKNFLNVQSITSGQVAFYVDEYDANGNWISGQYLKQETTPFVENMNFSYKPSSVAVSTASLQVIAGGSGITAYLDNMQMFAASSTALPNLVPNGTFDAGIADGWSTDAPTAIVADHQNHGAPANPTNAISLQAGSTNTHLFSPRVPVSSAQSYSLSSYANLLALNTGEFGYYVDEYDANGNWISGQYITGLRTLGVASVGFGYTPSSANVKTASLQLIVVGGSGLSGYFDDVNWYQN